MAYDCETTPGNVLLFFYMIDGKVKHALFVDNPT